MLSLRLCLPSFLLEVLAAGLGGLVIIFARNRVVAGAGHALMVVDAACSHSSCQEGLMSFFPAWSTLDQIDLKASM